jgi:8-oxo-dGTP diphosphatase
MTSDDVTRYGGSNRGGDGDTGGHDTGGGHRDGGGDGGGHGNSHSGFRDGDGDGGDGAGRGTGGDAGRGGRAAESGDGRGAVRAAGVLLWRESAADGGIELALVHRPKYDDWSWPKGKLKPGEDFAAAAVRETREETGMACVLGAPLPATRYPVDGRPKEVRYWAARAGEGCFTACREVDRIVWLPPAAARHRLTHDRDRPLVDALLALLRAPKP